MADVYQVERAGGRIVEVPIPRDIPAYERERYVRWYMWTQAQWSRPGNIYYALFNDGIVKIGQSVNPAKRIKRLTKQITHRQHTLVAAFYYPVDDMNRAECDAHNLHTKHEVSRPGETFKLPPGEYGRVRNAWGATDIPIINGVPA